MAKLSKSLSHIISSLVGEVRPSLGHAPAIVPRGTIIVHKEDNIKMRIVKELDSLGIVKIEENSFINYVTVTAGWRTWNPESTGKNINEKIEYHKKQIARDLGITNLDKITIHIKS